MGFVSRHPEKISSYSGCWVSPQDRANKSNGDVLEWTFKGNYPLAERVAGFMVYRQIDYRFVNAVLLLDGVVSIFSSNGLAGKGHARDMMREFQTARDNGER